MSHECFAPNCAIHVSAAKLACPHHWWQLPEDLRSRINYEFQTHGLSSRLTALQGEAFEFWTAKLPEESNG